jgi:hypothetical protein
MPDFDALSREDLVALIRQQAEQIASLKAELELLRKDPPSGLARPVSTAYVPKPSKPEREKKPRKKRQHSFVRHRQEPTVTVDHAVDNCPDCGRVLKDGWEHSVREVIEIPELPVEITHHRLIRRYCGVCKKSHLPKLDLRSEVVGRHRIGVRLMSLIAHMRLVCRMTFRTIQTFLMSTYRLHLSIGEIVELLHTVARKGIAAYDALRESLRSSPSVNADETGFRQNGVNGQAWAFCTPKIRYYIRAPSRSHAVPQSVLGSHYQGVICSDFYGGYNYHLGEHQRCWVHFLRTLHELKAEHPDHEGLIAWAAAVHGVFESARDYRSDRRRDRVRARDRLQRQLEELAKPFVDAEVPHRTLSRRIMNFSNEMLTFVEHPDVSPDNNAAERAIRPLVILRKVTGGTRSDQGSATLSVLMSLFATWQLTTTNTTESCRYMLTSPTR